MHMLMITVFVDNYNPISQKFYDNTINGLPFFQLSCSCGHSGCLTIHGYYNRSVKSGTSSIRLKVCRVRCSLCGRTHALMLSSMVPYSSVPLVEQINIISHSLSDSDFSSIMDTTPSIDESCVRSIIRRYRMHWLQRILSENISLCHISGLVQRCFSCFRRQFMQIKNTPNILFLTPT